MPQRKTSTLLICLLIMATCIPRIAAYTNDDDDDDALTVEDIIAIFNLITSFIRLWYDIGFFNTLVVFAVGMVLAFICAAILNALDLSDETVQNIETAGFACNCVGAADNAGWLVDKVG